MTYSKQWKGPSMRLRHSNFSDLVMLLTMMLFLVYITTPRLLSAAYRCRTNFWLYRDICALRDNAVKKSVNDADHCMEVYSWCWTVIEQYYCTITKNKEELIYSVDKCREVFLCFFDSRMTILNLLITVHKIPCVHFKITANPFHRKCERLFLLWFNS